MAKSKSQIKDNFKSFVFEEEIGDEIDSMGEMIEKIKRRIEKIERRVKALERPQISI